MYISNNWRFVITESRSCIFQGFIYAVVVRYIHFILEQGTYKPAVRRNAPLWFFTHLTYQTHIMYGIYLLWPGNY